MQGFQPRHKLNKTEEIVNKIRKIHQCLLAVLGNEDDYVNVSTLMLKITNYHYSNSSS